MLPPVPSALAARLRRGGIAEGDHDASSLGPVGAGGDPVRHRAAPRLGAARGRGVLGGGRPASLAGGVGPQGYLGAGDVARGELLVDDQRRHAVGQALQDRRHLQEARALDNVLVDAQEGEHCDADGRLRRPPRPGVQELKDAGLRVGGAGRNLVEQHVVACPVGVQPGGRLRGEQLDQDHSHGVHLAPLGRDALLRVLRGTVPRRAADGTLRRPPLVTVPGGAREAEVRDLRDASGCEEDVLRRDIAVEDLRSELVEVRQASAGLDCSPQPVQRGVRRLRVQLGERVASGQQLVDERALLR
mmetsp:Transcript_51783/g.145935  ORF Transcript_51783/g.145935 Transcript_51783/m.145935 type:complete len:302 (+) Transcript_51783:1284-2189(+)